MANWLTLSKKKNPKTKQLWGREFNLVEDGLDEKQVTAYVEELIAQRETAKNTPSQSIRTIIERAVADAEKLAGSIKQRAQKEAEDEAGRILERARLEAREIRRLTEETAKQETEEVLNALNEKARQIEEGAKQKIELLLLHSRQEIENGVREEYKEIQARLLHSLPPEIKETPHEPEKPAAAVKSVEPVQKTPETGVAAKANKEKAEPVIQKPAEAGKTATGNDKQSPVNKASTPEKPAGEKKNKSSWFNMIFGKKDDKTKDVKQAHAQKEVKPAIKPEAVKKTENPAPSSTIKAKPGWLNMTIGKKTSEKAPSAETKPGLVKIEAASNPKTAAVQPGKGASVANRESQKAKESPKKQTPEKKPESPAPAGIVGILDYGMNYSGEIDLVIAVPVEPVAVTKLYNFLQSAPDIKILYTRGSWDRGTTITVSLEKPLPLISMISKIQGLKIAPGFVQKDSPVTGKRKDTARIDLILKTDEAAQK